MMNTQEARARAEEAKPAPVFALDIGTRSVIGIVGVQKDGMFHVLDMETREHTKRAMYDGQIEDIEQVALVARLVKEELERRQGLTFQHVCVAAAGRALKTMRAEHEMQLSAAEPITARAMYEMEMGAVAKAREQLVGETLDGQQLYCVGHAVVRYHLDGYPFLTILNHRGREARVEIIATFLPNEVVESLYSAMGMIGLEIDHLTLEPIAAMNAVIPPELRLLNLALVDIGAGTSDIAISENGSVAAYTMATIAGDEITESIIHCYLVDFATAEAMKHAAADGLQSIPYRDILGFDYEISMEGLLATIRPAVEELGRVICEKIYSSNGDKAPSAVFLVGGGSRVPLLCGMIAENLGIEEKKVAIGGNNFMKRVAHSGIALEGPEYATPLGIALTALSSGSYEGFFVLVNEKRMRVFRSQAMTVMDVLLLSGFKYSDLMGKNGKSLTYELNGEPRFLRGGYLVPAQITINGVSASISTPVANGDSIHVLPATSGKNAHLTAAELEPDPAELFVTLNGTPIAAGRRILINGSIVRPEDEVHDLDRVEHFDVSTLGALCAQMGISAEGSTLAVNGVAQVPSYRLRAGDRILCIASSGDTLPQHLAPFPVAMQSAPLVEPQHLAPPPVAMQSAPLVEPQHLAPFPVAMQSAPLVESQHLAPFPVATQPAPLVEPQHLAPFPVATQPVPLVTPMLESQHSMEESLHITLNGDTRVLPKQEQEYQFLDMFNLVDLDPTNPQGNIVLKLNGREAAYLEAVNDGDDVEIYWDK